jgi:Uma2 family endonuclease
MSAVHEKLYTVEEFFRLIPDRAKGDLLDGKIYRASPESLADDRLGYLIRFLLRGFSRERGLGGEVTGSRVAYVLGVRRAPEPDVAYVSESRRHILTPTRGTAAPDVAVEIVSEDSRDRDYGDKRRLYEEAGVGEYWFIDPLIGRCEFLRLENGRFVPTPLESGSVFRSALLPGFWLDTAWLLSDPLPDEYDGLARLLGSQST